MYFVNYFKEYSNTLIELIKMYYPDETIKEVNIPPDNVEEDFLCIEIKKNDLIISINDFRKIYKGYNINSINRKYRILDIKKILYNLLKEYKKKSLKWGILTGIRPGLIVIDLINKGLKENEIKKILNEVYYIANEKANLLYTIVENEMRILSNITENEISFYINIPFCSSKCSYCSFPSIIVDGDSDKIKEYLNVLYWEIEKTNEILCKADLKISSIYIGGGTPTIMNENMLNEFFSNLNKIINIECLDLKEYTFEAGRPDSINREKLKILKNNNVTRICINPQTMNEKTLNYIGRNHGKEDIINKFYMARSEGFNNINMDIILGLPGECIDDFNNSLKEIGLLNPESITFHQLAIKRASILKRIDYKHDVDMGLVDEMVSRAMNFCKKNKMKPYYIYRQKNMAGNGENIGFCKEGFESYYNMIMIEDLQTVIGVGAGAVTKVLYKNENRIERAFNVKDLSGYINRIGEMIQRKEKLILDRRC